jgi:hypothetical protein
MYKMNPQFLKDMQSLNSSTRYPKKSITPDYKKDKILLNKDYKANWEILEAVWEAYPKTIHNVTSFIAWPSLGKTGFCA